MHDISHADLHRDIGALEARMELFHDDMKQAKDDIRQIRDMLSQTQGGWKVLASVASIGAAGGALAAKILMIWK